MNEHKLSHFLKSLWSQPDPVMAEAAVAGPLVARIRLSLAVLLLLIPLIDIFFFPQDPKEGLVGISLGAGTLLVAAVVYVLISRNYNPSWLRFASSSYDVTQHSSRRYLKSDPEHPGSAAHSCRRARAEIALRRYR